MKALTLWQPYASAIALAAHNPRGKLCENRTWSPPASLIGQRIAIHAATKKPDPAWGLPPGAAELLGDVDRLPRSAIVCTALVVGALDCRDGLPGQVLGAPALISGVRRVNLLTLTLDPWWIGPVGWLLDDVRACAEPVACKGAMGLWTVPDDVAALVERQTARAA